MSKQKILANWNFIEREYRIESLGWFFNRFGNFFTACGGVGVAPAIPKFVAKDDRSRFYSALCRYCDSKKISETDLYNRAKISRAIFSNIRSMGQKNYLPSKSTVLCLCLALKLSVDESQKLLKICGYYLSDSLIIDKVIAWCMENDCYDLDDIDGAIFEQTGRYFLAHS